MSNTETQNGEQETQINIVLPICMLKCNVRRLYSFRRNLHLSLFLNVWSYMIVHAVYLIIVWQNKLFYRCPAAERPT